MHKYECPYFEWQFKTWFLKFFLDFTMLLNLYFSHATPEVWTPKKLECMDDGGRTMVGGDDGGGREGEVVERK